MSGETPEPDGSGDADSPRGRLAAIRDDTDRRRIALAAATLVGLVAAAIHWLGLFVGGALVGLVSESLRRAVLAALGFGVLVLAAFLLASPAMSAGELLALRPPVYVTVAAAVVLPVLGSLLRGVV